MKLTLYIDEIDISLKPADIWLTLVMAFKFLGQTVKEEWEFWTFFYPYEYRVPPLEDEREAGMRDFDKRMKKSRNRGKAMTTTTGSRTRNAVRIFGWLAW